MFLPKIKFRPVWALHFATVSALIPAVAFAQNAPKLSLQGEDYSDHLFLELEKGDASNTMAYHGLTGNNQSALNTTPRRLGNHKDGDIAVPADYTGNGVTNMAIVRVGPSGAKKRLHWEIHNGSTKLSPISFGAVGATVLGGCDFSGDNQADLAFVRGRNFRFRSVSDSGATGSFRLGGGKHIAFFCADTTGDGHDELIALSHRKNNDKARFFNVWSHDGQHLVRRANFGGKRKPNVIAADVNGDGKASIGFFRNIPGGSRLVFLTDNGAEEIDLSERIRRPGGNYELARGTHITQSSGMAEGITFAARGGSYFKFNFADRVVSALNASNLGADSSNRVVLLRDVNAIGTAAGASSSGLGAVCPNIIAVGPTGFLNKPQAEHTNDQRTGKPVYLWTSNKPGVSNVNIYASNGQKISQASRYFAGTTKYGDRFYACWGSSPCHTGSQMAALAQSAAGSPNVYIQGKPGHCHGPFHPAQRSGAIHY